MKRIFSIEWPEDLGPMWMSKDNLIACLFSNSCVGGQFVPKIKVEDITEEAPTQKEVEELSRELQQTHNKLKRFFRLGDNDT